MDSNTNKIFNTFGTLHSSGASCTLLIISKEGVLKSTLTLESDPVRPHPRVDLTVTPLLPQPSPRHP